MFANASYCSAETFAGNEVKCRILRTYELDSVIENNPFILYHGGHHTLNWALVIKTESGYNTYYGNINSKEKTLYSMNISGSSNIFDWAFSFPYDSITYTLAPKQRFSTANDYIIICDRYNHIIFEHDFTKIVTKENTKNFKTQIDKLLVALWWVAHPDMRHLINCPFLYKNNNNRTNEKITIQQNTMPRWNGITYSPEFD